MDPAMLGEMWVVPPALLTKTVRAAADAKFGTEEVAKWLARRAD